MAEKVPSNWKRCATCVYWTGPREVDTFGNYVTTASGSTEGRCMCRSGSYRVSKCANYVCMAYVKWPALS